MANIISKIIARDISTLRAGCSDETLIGAGLLVGGTPEATNAADNKYVSDACSTREAGELIAGLGDKAGTLATLSMTVRSECAKHVVTGTKRQYISPAWAKAVSVNRLAKMLRADFGVE